MIVTELYSLITFSCNIILIFNNLSVVRKISSDFYNAMLLTKKNISMSLLLNKRHMII